jgi:hypothetical protein
VYGEAERSDAERQDASAVGQDRLVEHGCSDAGSRRVESASADGARS